MKGRIRSSGAFLSVWLVVTLAAAARSAIVDSAAVAAFATFFWAVVQGAGLWFAHQNDGSPPKKTTDIVAGIGLAAAALEYITAGFAPALTSLLLWLQAARNPVLRERRDVYFALAIALTLVIFGAAEAKSSAYLVAIMAFGFAAFMALVYCHEHRGIEAERNDEAQPTMSGSLTLVHQATLVVLVFSIAAAWYLLVPRPQAANIGAVATRAGERYSNAEWEREAKDSSTPQRRKDANRLSGKGDRPSAEPSEGDVDIRRTGANRSGQPANAIVMYVQADRSLYLRERTFDRFDGSRWARTDIATTKLLPGDGREFAFVGPDTGLKRDYVVHVVQGRSNAIPLSAHVRALAAPVAVVAQAKDGSVYLPARIESGFQYRAASAFRENLDRPVAFDDSRPRDRYLQLPEGQSSRISELASSVTRTAASTRDKALSLEAHLRENYRYSFESVFSSQGVTPLEEFLFETRRGHCEYFASAMAIMLRSIGVPSRLVQGFLAQSYNPVTGFYEVRAFDGHAWVEAYIDGVGWMTFEPTAAYPLPQRRSKTNTALDDLKQYTENLAKQDELQHLGGLTAYVAEAFRLAVEGWHEALLLARLLVDSLRGWLEAHAVGLSLSLGGLGLIAFYVYRQRRQVAWAMARVILLASPTSTIAIATFREIQRVARAAGLPRATGETADEYLARLECSMPELQPQLRLLKAAFNEARYDGKTCPGDKRKRIIDVLEAVGKRLVSLPVSP